MDNKKTIIYVDSSYDNSVFVIKTVRKVINGESLPLITEEHTSFSDEEKIKIKAFLVEKGKDEETIDILLRLKWARSDSPDFISLMSLIKEHNLKNAKEEIIEEYFNCYIRGNQKPIISKINDPKITKIGIDCHKIFQICEFDGKILNNEEIIKVISDFKNKNDVTFIVGICPNCNRYTLFKSSNGRKVCSCESCGREVDFNVTLSVMETKDYSKATNLIKEKNSKFEKDNEESKPVVFKYKGTPYSLFDSYELFSLVMRNGDASAFFDKENERIVLNKNFQKYIESLAPRESKSVISELENLQNNSAEYLYFDENAALFWLYHYFSHAEKATSKEERNFIKTKLGKFSSPTEFVNKFLDSSSDDQLYLLSLLHPTYIEYFLDPDNLYFVEDNISLSFAKLIYALTCKYVYISISQKEIYVFSNKVFDELINHDNLSYQRYLFLKFISRDIEYFTHKDIRIDYESKLKDGYDLNCYFYMLYKGNNYYQFETFKISLSPDDAQKEIYQGISDAYLYNKKLYLETLLNIYNAKYLQSPKMIGLNARIGSIFNTYFSDKDLLNLYLSTKGGQPLETIPIRYGNDVENIFTLAEYYLNRNSLVEFSKDKTINFILGKLITNKEEVISKAKVAFDDLCKEVNRLMEEH